MQQTNANFFTEITSNLPSLARIGKLLCGKSIVETPYCLLTTKGGSVPYLSREVLEYVLKDQNVNQVLQISLSNCNHMQDALRELNIGISQFIGFKELPTFITLNDPCEVTPSGFNEQNVVPMFTRKGKELLSPEKYMEFMTSMQPDIYEMLCDSDTNATSSKKRVLKSFGRSENFAKKCVEIHKNCDSLSKSMILWPLVGGYNKDIRFSNIKATKEFSNIIGGYSFHGFHNNGFSTLEVDNKSLIDIVSDCVKEINDDKMRVMQGAYDPVTILDLINLGIDIFDTSYVYLATQTNNALCFDFDLKDNESKKLFHINLNEDKHKEEFIPIRKDCTCLTCNKHTRAYIYHLIQTKELLGPILLMIHNLHHYLQFFETIRKVIPQNNLAKLTKLVKEQMCTENSKCIIKDIAADNKKPINLKESPF